MILISGQFQVTKVTILKTHISEMWHIFYRLFYVEYDGDGFLVIRAHFGESRQDYFTIKVCSAGKSDRRRDVTQGNPLRLSEWGFKIGYFPNIFAISVYLAAFH